MTKVRLKEGAKLHKDGKVYRVGDIVELTDAQMQAWADLVEDPIVQEQVEQRAQQLAREQAAEKAQRDEDNRKAAQEEQERRESLGASPQEAGSGASGTEAPPEQQQTAKVAPIRQS